MFTMTLKVLDSGADHSCLPLSFASIGCNPAASEMSFRDAHGNLLASRGTREASLSLGSLAEDDVTVKDRWLIAPVTSPLLSLGKLDRAGWSVTHAEDEQLVLQRADVKVPVYMRQNSLCVKGSIHMVRHAEDVPPVLEDVQHLQPDVHLTCLGPSSSGRMVSEPRLERPKYGGGTLGRSSYGEMAAEPRFEGPKSLPQPREGLLNALSLHGPWRSLKEPFVELGAGLYANRCYSLGHVDCSIALPNVPIPFRTTLMNSVHGWRVHALNEELSALSDPEAPFGDNALKEIITIASTYCISILQLFPPSASSRVDPEPVLRDPSDDDPIPAESEGVRDNPGAADDADDDMNIEGLLAPPAEAVAQDVENEPHVEGEAQVEGETPRPPGEEPIVIDGIELTLACSLAVLRAAAAKLGLGRSGGKATVLRRIREHFKRHDLLQQHCDAKVPEHLPREQSIVPTPTPEEVRMHNLAHTPYRPWCTACVENRARADRHVRHRAPTVSMPPCRLTLLSRVAARLPIPSLYASLPLAATLGLSVHGLCLPREVLFNCVT